MENSQRYPFVAADMDFGEAGFRPYLPLILNLFLSIRTGF